MNNSYVYILLNPLKSGEWHYGSTIFYNEPFYVGKGVGDRYKVHYNLNRIKYETNYSKSCLIKNLIESGNPPICQKIFTNLSDNEAKVLEKAVIKYFGKVLDKSGILLNIVDGGDSTGGNSLGECNSHSKQVYQYGLDGKFLKKWGSLREVGRELNVPYNNIGDNCRGKTKTSCGYQWFYEFKGPIIKAVKVRENTSTSKSVYKFNCRGELIIIYKSLTEAARNEHSTKQNLASTIKKKIFYKEFFYSYDNTFNPKSLVIKNNDNLRYYNIVFNKKHLTLTNRDIMKKFNVSRYYVNLVSRGKIKNSIFSISN